MNKPTNVQIINGPDGRPAFAVIPYEAYLRSRKDEEEVAMPHEVVGMIVLNGWSPIRAWREHLGVTQQEMAERLGISQPAFAQQESSARPRKATRERVAAALGIFPEQLLF
ncbi:helix-turn-helix domain-containing protein [Pseudoduganella sp. R-43]|uniref:helix-turn-helix domain-containing protein n=1 Tax=unclassified Pseudoduganella TaxID=2637179 RepID=UPI003CEB1051